MVRHALGAVAVALAVASADPAAAQQAKAGVLTCDVSAGIGLIIGSQKQVSCVFSPDLPGPRDPYMGAMTKFGLDIGITGGGVMVWAVFTSTTALGPGFLAGDYVGASAEASIAVGLGANVLVGGSNRTISLQPVSIEGNTGLNVAAGIGSISLRYLPQAARPR
jgi:Protein of unknown function (DUF992)